MFQKTGEKQEADKDSGQAFFFLQKWCLPRIKKLEGEKNSVDGKV